MVLWMVMCDSLHANAIIESETEPVVSTCPICGNSNIRVVLFAQG